MAQEIYHRSEWGNPNEQWGNVYLNADLTNELYKRASEYENSWVTDQLLNGVGTKPSIILTPTAYEDGVLNSVKPKRTFGSELVTNGTFDTDSDWLKSNATISGGKATINIVSGAFAYIDQFISYTNGRVYNIKATLNGTSGKIARVLDAGGNNGGLTTSSQGLITLDGTDQNIDITWTANSNSAAAHFARDSSGDWSFTVDNVSVKEVIDADFDFTRGSSATRVNEQGLIQDVQILSDELVQNGNFEEIGSELVTNGGFDTDSDWTLPSGASISDGSLNFDGTQTGTINVRQTITSLDLTKIYKVTFTVSNYTAGQVKVKISNDAQGTNKTANGTYTEYLSGMANNALSFTANVDFTGSIDNVSVKEVGQNWNFGTGWSMGDGKAVKTSGTGASLSQTLPITVIGKKYKFTFDANVTSGVANASLYGVTIPNFTTSGSQEHTVTATSTSGFNFYAAANFNGSIDNISVIEITDDTDLPRINYTNFDYENGVVVPYSGEGSLLLEPQSTNLIAYSEDFSNSYWTKGTNGSGSVTINQNAITSPDGALNADEIVIVGGAGNLQFLYRNITGLTITNGNKYNAYVYVKGQGTIDLIFRFGGGAQGSTVQRLTLSNTWVKHNITLTATGSASNAEVFFQSQTGATSINFYAWGFQVEEGSYATSYIPTEGSIKTRLADVCNNSGNSDLINSTEGVLYAEISALADDGTNRVLSLSNGSYSNSIRIQYYQTSNQLEFRVVSSGSIAVLQRVAISDTTLFNKILVKYKLNDFALWVNGFEISTDTSGATPIGLNDISFDDADGNFPFYGNVKCVAVFKEALSDTELQKLTTI